MRSRGLGTLGDVPRTGGRHGGAGARCSSFASPRFLTDRTRGHHASMPAPGSQPSIEGELRVQLSILEAMFEPATLERLRKRRPNHPALVRSAAIRTLLAKQQSAALLREMAVMTIDRQTWAQASPTSGDYWTCIPDPDVRAYVKRNIEDPGCSRIPLRNSSSKVLFVKQASQPTGWSERVTRTLSSPQGLPKKLGRMSSTFD